MNDLRPKLDYLDHRARQRVLSALEVANVAHSGQMRKSGEPFIIHPIAVAAILADLRMDRDCIIAGLLHDTVEDTPVTLEDLETLFGTDVRRIVEGETKLSKLAKKVRSDAQEGCSDETSSDCEHDAWADGNAARSQTDSAASDEGMPEWKHEQMKREEEQQKQADNLRAMFIAMTEDVRVIIVKLADRLHNMRTLAHMSVVKQKKISKETLEFFAPLAHRLGMRRIKSELEELSFMYLHAEEYQHLKYEVETMLRRSKYAHYLKSAEATVSDVLRQDRILYKMIRSVEVKGSTKELYSIFRRMQVGENVASMIDIATMRVVVDLDPGVNSNQACYHVLGRIHTLWQPFPPRLKDYIAFPKPNGYQSLHTTVRLGPKFAFMTMEIQIRTAEMDRIAEEGIAAELFKATPEQSGDFVNADEDKDDDLDGVWRRRTTGWLISIREYIEEFSSSKDLVDAVRKDLLGNRVFVFTPKGNIVDLPKDSTAIDVAYRIHSDVGHNMIGAKVNGRMVGLDYKMQNADVVQIIGSQWSKGPSAEWISFAKSRTARQKIRQFLRGRDRDNMVDRGRRMLEDEARGMMEPLPRENCLVEILPKLRSALFVEDGARGFGSVDDLYVTIATGRSGEGNNSLERTVLRLLRDRRHAYISQAVDGTAGDGKSVGVGQGNGSGRHVEGVLAPCCHPIRGDEVVGIRMCGGVDEAVVIHRKGCEQVRSAEKGCYKGRAERVGVRWAVRSREAHSDGVHDVDEVGDDGWHDSWGGEEGAEDNAGKQPSRVVVVASDCTGLLAYVTGVIASMGTSIRRCSTVTNTADLMATLAFEVLVTDCFHLGGILERIEECDEVELARRVEPHENSTFFGDAGGATCHCKWDGAGVELLLREGESVAIRELEFDGLNFV